MKFTQLLRNKANESLERPGKIAMTTGDIIVALIMSLVAIAMATWLLLLCWPRVSWATRIFALVAFALIALYPWADARSNARKRTKPARIN
jgi:glycerol-3-phosphate acyltransferase PlsY